MVIRVSTTAEVWRALLNSHIENLSVYASFSDSDGSYGGQKDHGSMYTRWGWKNVDSPLMEADTTFDLEWVTICGVYTTVRKNETTVYFLLVTPTTEDDE